MSEPIPMFFSFDDNYVAQAGVTFVSLLSNAKEGVYYDLNVVHTDISENNQIRLYRCVEKYLNATLTFINIAGRFDLLFNDEVFSIGHAGAKFTIETLYRTLASKIIEFDKYETIIYSDVDIVVVDDISELYDIDLKDKYIVGVKTPKFLDHQFEHLDKKFAGHYICAGLWVMNLKEMRKDNLGEKILAIINNPPCRLIWPDQDVMNLACDLNVGYISYRYVSIPCWYNMLKKMGYKDEYYTNNELYDAVFSPKIIHFAATKPWVEYRCQSSQLWYEWLEQTEFIDDFEDFIGENTPNKIFGVRFIKNSINVDVLTILPFKLFHLKTKLFKDYKLFFNVGKYVTS